MKQKIIFTLLFSLLIISGLFAQNTLGYQESTWNKKYLPKYHIFKVRNGAASSDSVSVIQTARSFSEPFRHWKKAIVQMYVSDSGTTDSVKFVVQLEQFARENTSTIADTAKYSARKILSWYGPHSTTAADTVTSVGYWMAEISRDDTLTFPSVYDIFKVRPFANHKKLTGVSLQFIVVAWVED